MSDNRSHDNTSFRPYFDALIVTKLEELWQLGHRSVASLSRQFYERYGIKDNLSHVEAFIKTKEGENYGKEEGSTGTNNSREVLHRDQSVYDT